jgi:glycosyltransferase involved in cell wall biosynthesis
MRAGIDATPLTISSGGIRRYTEELARALTQTFPADEFVLIAERPRNFLERRWWLWGLNRELVRQRLEVFHGTNFAVPYLPLRPSVLTLHDLSLWMDRGWHVNGSRDRRRTPFLLGLGTATMVITPSETVRRQAIERFRLPHGRVIAVPEGCRFQPVDSTPASVPYFLFTGTLEPRKNIPFLLAVWREVRKQAQVELWLAGRRRFDFPEIPAEPGLRLLGEVPDRELPALYAGAAAFLYPSLYEGFGLPVLEAMACGACVITSADPAIGEVAGESALRLDVRDNRVWIQSLLAVLTGGDWVERLRERALQRAAEFTWERTALMTREVYVEAMRRF